MTKQRIWYITDILVLGTSVLSAMLGFTDHAIAGLGIYLTGQAIKQYNITKD